MAPKVVVAAVVFAAFLAGTPSMADGYRPDEFLGLDLSKAALSPKPLGPPAQFEPVPVEAKADAQNRATHVSAEPKPAPKIRVGHVRAEKRHSIVHAKPATAATKLVRRHTNPLDAQAFDTRIQVWPCRSGGICNWQRPATE
jgi:hypothetical protein